MDFFISIVFIVSMALGSNSTETSDGDNRTIDAVTTSESNASNPYIVYPVYPPMPV